MGEGVGGGGGGVCGGRGGGGGMRLGRMCLSCTGDGAVVEGR